MKPVRRLALTLALTGATLPAGATTFLDFSGGTLTGWTTFGNTTVLTTGTAFTISGSPFSLTPAPGHGMARIFPSGGGSSPDALLGLSASSVETLLNAGGQTVTNFGVVTRSFSLSPGTYTFAWSYAAQDYVPYNDGVMFSVVGNGSQSIVSLARNGLGPSDLSGPSPNTLILGSYGTTPWQTASFDITAPGTYQVGFAAYNWDDTSLNPILYISDIAGSYTGTPPVITGGGPPPPPPVIGGTGGNVSGTVFDTSSPAYAEPTLAFDGGTLQYSADTVTAKNATLGAGGGAIDTTSGHVVTYSGAISGGGDFTKLGNGTLLLSADNTYTGATVISAGVLALQGAGSIAASSGVTNDGVLDISGTGGASLTTLTGGGSVVLGSQTLTFTSASGTFAGTIGGNGGIDVTGGAQTLGGVNLYAGATSIASGATLALTGGGSITASSGVTNDGLLDISGTSTGASITALAGNGDVALGSKTLTLTNASGSLGGTIAGTGGVTVDAGTQSFSGANLYSGATTIASGGTLALTGSGSIAASSGVMVDGTFDVSTTTGATSVASLAGGGNVVLGANTLALTGAAGTFAGVLDGTGGLGIVAGTQTLAGANAYTGATSIASGATLALSGNGSIATSSGVTNDGTLDLTAVTGGASVTSITGNGGIALGSNALTLTAAQGTLGGAISGDGALHVIGGSLELAGNNTYAGGTSVSGATLIVSHDAALGDPAGALTLSDATYATTATFSTARELHLAGAGDVDTTAQSTLTLGGQISGSGLLTKTGAGKLVLAADNDTWGSASTGGFAIAAGEVEITHANALGHGRVTLESGTLITAVDVELAQAFVAGSDATLDTQSRTVILSGPVTTGGSGSCFRKVGNGSLVMAGDATLGNGTCVIGGRLSANGQLNSVVTVEAGGTLRGTGVVNGPVGVTGRLAPGNSPGTLTVTSTVTMAAGSTLQLDINGTGTASGAGSYSRLIVTGAGSQFVVGDATLEPRLLDISGGAFVPYVPQLGDSFRIVTAEGGVVGEFGALLQPAGLAPGTRLALFYDSLDSIDLRVLALSYQTAVAKSGANANAVSVGRALDALLAQPVPVAAGGTPGLTADISALNVDELPQAAVALAGEVHGAMAAGALSADRWLLGTLSRQLSSAAAHADDPATAGNTLWADFATTTSRWQPDADASRFSADRWQTAVGFDLVQTQAALFGLGVQLSRSDIDATGGRGEIEETLGFVYAQVAAGPFLVDAIAGHGRGDWRTWRADAVDPDASQRGMAHDNHTLLSGALRYPWAVRRVAIEPFAQATWQRVSRGELTESGPTATALTLPKYTASGLQLGAGLVLGSEERDPLLTSFGWQATVGTVLDDADLLRPVVAASLGGVPIEVRSPRVGRLAAQLGGMVTARLSARGYGFLGLTGELRSGMRDDYGMNAGLRMQF